MSQKNASKSLPAASDIPFGHSWHNTKTPSVVRNGLSAVTMPSRSVAVLINPQWGRENYAGIGSLVLHTPVHPAYALFGLPSMTTRPVCSP